MTSIMANYQPQNLRRSILLALLCICMISLTVAVDAQETNGVAARVQKSASQREVAQPAFIALPQLSQKPPNQAQCGSFTTEGIAVQVAKTANPLQLINPAAPAEYGWAEANVVRDPTNKRVLGLKIFSFQF